MWGVNVDRRRTCSKYRRVRIKQRQTVWLEVRYEISGKEDSLVELLVRGTR